MNEGLVKIKISLPEDDDSGGQAEWVWALPLTDDIFKLKNIPVFAYNLSFDDEVHASSQDGVPVYDGVVKHMGHSTYRIYAKNTRTDPQILNLLSTLKGQGCEFENATNKIVAVDVWPAADIHVVYRTLQAAEDSGILEFDEGHCGHPVRS
jgi:hypothetical protein